MNNLLPLESARLKIDRAYKDVLAFNREVEEFLGTAPFTASRKRESGGKDHVYYAEIRSTPPPALGTAVGNVLHNLRSALDSIVYDVSISATPTLTEDDKRRIGFPVALEETALPEGSMQFAPEAARAEIKASQPYNGAVPVQHPLWLIHELNRIDKHRFVQVIPALVMGSFWIEPPVPMLEEQRRPIGPFDDRAELSRFTFAEPQPEVDIRFRPMFNVALPLRTYPAELELRDFTNHIRDEVLPRFEQFIAKPS